MNQEIENQIGLAEKRFRIVKFISYIWLVQAGFFLLIGVVFAIGKNPDAAMSLIGFLCGGVFFSAFNGVRKKAHWGHALGVAISCIMLIGIPIGTIIGGVALYGLWGSKTLFISNKNV